MSDVASFGDVIYQDGYSWIDFIRQLEQSKQITAKAADRALGNIGSAGRRVITEREKNEFQFGQLQYKGQRRGWGIYTRYDDTMGGWKSRNSNSRMVGFTYEKAAWSGDKNSIFNSKRRKMYSAISVGHIYSRISNLWDKQTKPYSTDSPEVGSARGMIKWRKGDSRPARKVWDTSSIRPIVSQAMNKAGNEMVEKLKKELEK